jgi:alanine racemase
MNRHGTFSERSYTPKLAGLDDLGSSLITLTVDLAAYRQNLRLLTGFIAPAKVIAVVKANAYGFGVAGLLPILSEFEDISLGVATPDEALELKALGWAGRIILLGYTHPKCYYQIVHSGCQLSAYRPENIAPLAAAARELMPQENPRPLELHIKVDTGMARLGVGLDELPGLIREVRAHPELRIVGLFSHQVDSGDPEAAINSQQQQLFRRAIDMATAELGYRPECHLANSGGALNFPGLHLDAARVGLLQFGVWPGSDGGGRASLRAKLGGHGGPPSETSATALPLTPCYRLSSEVIDTHRLLPGGGVSYCHTWHADRPTTIVTLPFGYADGMPRNLSNVAAVLIGGRRCPLRGNVCMDYVMADVGDADVQLGDEAVFVGRQGAEAITLEEVAEQAGTIPYELSCRWGRRVRRVYVGA